MVHLVTGFAGVEHIQSEDDGAFNASFFGEGQFVMEQGNQFEASITNNNTVRVLDGNGLMYGRHFRIKPNTYEDLTIETGTAGTKRIDLIVMTYEKDSVEGTETAYLQVIKGQETSGTPSVPSYTDGNILEGATLNQMPLYKVYIEGVVLTRIESLFSTKPTYETLADKYEREFVEACTSHLDSLNVLDSQEEIEANTQENQLAGALGVKEIAGKLSHIGMIIHSTTLDTEAKVKAIYGGISWAKIEGRMLLGQSSDYAVNGTGGSATNTLSVENLPSHNHGLNNHTHSFSHTHGTDSKGGHSHKYYSRLSTNFGSGSTGLIYPVSASEQQYSYDTSSAGAHTHTTNSQSTTTTGKASGNTTSTGSGTAVNNMPPYKVVYIWERTA